MSAMVQVSGLSVAKELSDFVRDEALPGTGVAEDAFWEGLAAIVADLGPRRRELLTERERLQHAIDDHHRAHPGAPTDQVAYQRFLTDLGYLVPEPDEVTITTENVDPEICAQPGPQLVVPLLNARFAINAANARWGSLYDALYGTDVLPEDDGLEKEAPTILVGARP